MLEKLLDAARIFYEDPKNVQAYEAWLESKEENQNGNHQCFDFV